jgi:hypothetical protein
MIKFKLSIVALAIHSISSVGVLVLNQPFALASHCGFLDITCPQSHWCPPNCPSPPPQPIDRHTPRRVSTARGNMSNGYRCIEVKEYPEVTCKPPSEMEPSEFKRSNASYHGPYLGSNRDWSWDCLNNKGQLWGKANGELLCQPNMR